MVSILKKWQALPNWVKAFLKRAALSGLVLTIVAHLATHWYALRHGARIPLEGVPFLVVLSLVLGIIVSIISVMTLAFMPLARNFTTDSKVNPFVSDNLEGVQSDSIFGSFLQIWSRNLRSIKAGLLSGLTLSALVTVTTLGFHWADFASSFSSVASLLIAIGLTVLTVSFLVLVLLNALTIRMVEKFSLAVYVISLITISAMMMGALFDQVLRITRFGGGVKVIVSMVEQGPTYDGALFMISSGRIVIYDIKTDSYFELNDRHVESITYQEDPSWYLPASKSVPTILAGPSKSLRDDPWN